MESHPVPQNVTAFEFHLIGNLTMKQFGYLAIGLVIAYVTFILLAQPLPFVAYPIIFLSASIGAAYAFLPIMERPLDHWTGAFIKAIMRPTLRKYKSSAKLPENQFENRLALYLNQIKKTGIQQVDEQGIAKQVAENLIVHQALTQTSQPQPTQPEPPKMPQPVPQTTPVQPQPAPIQPVVNPTPVQAVQPVQAQTPIQPKRDFSTLTPITQPQPAQPQPVQPQPTPALVTPPVSDFSQLLNQVQPSQPAPVSPMQQAPLPQIAMPQPPLMPVIPEPQIEEPKEEEEQLAQTLPEDLPTDQELNKTVSLAREAQIIQNKIVETEKRIESIKSGAATPGEDPKKYTQEFQAVLIDLQKLNEKAREISHELAELSKTSSPVMNAPVVKPNIIPTLTLTSTPNIINGIVTDSQGNYIEGAIVVAHDKQGIPVRALKTNKLGQFIAATPLNAGTYTITVEKENLAFDIAEIELKDQVINPIIITAKKGVVS